MLHKNVSGILVRDQEENVPMDKTILKQFLYAGYMENGLLKESSSGMPQGGIISPCISLIALSGLEQELTKKYKKCKVNIVSYADDFIITGKSKELLEQEVIPTTAEFLRERGLELSNTKTQITHINDGFDFLGFNIRKYGEKCITKPSKTAVKTFLQDINKIIKTNVGAKTENLLFQLNPKIRGWVNYYHHSASSKTFSYIDHRIFQMLYRWAQKRHANKGFKWINQKYFQRNYWNNWHFHAKTQKHNCIELILAGRTKIKRHSKIKSAATPYKPEYNEYLRKRSGKLKTSSTSVAGSDYALAL